LFGKYAIYLDMHQTTNQMLIHQTPMHQTHQTPILANGSVAPQIKYAFNEGMTARSDAVAHNGGGPSLKAAASTMPFEAGSINGADNWVPSTLNIQQMMMQNGSK
jgi:hypothetical protein